MNKSAKEMFEDLGYDYFNNGLRITYEKCPDGECKMIEFNLKNKNVILADDNDEVIELNVKEIQAINQQCKELGWLDDKKKEINYQKPFAIKYMLDNKRLYGTEWYCKLKCLEGSDK